MIETVLSFQIWFVILNFGHWDLFDILNLVFVISISQLKFSKSNYFWDYQNHISKPIFLLVFLKKWRGVAKPFHHTTLPDGDQNIENSRSGQLPGDSGPDAVD